MHKFPGMAQIIAPSPFSCIARLRKFPTLNVLSYARNNPIAFGDHDGMLLGALVGGQIGAGWCCIYAGYKLV